MRKALKVFSVLYWIGAVFFGIYIGLTFASGDILNSFKDYLPISIQNVDPKVFFGIVFGILAVVSAIIAIGTRRIANKESRGILTIILLSLSVTSTIYSIFTQFNVSTLIYGIVSLIVLCITITVSMDNSKN